MLDGWGGKWRRGVLKAMLKLRRWKRREETLCFNEVWEGVKSCLVCLLDDKMDASFAEPVIDKMCRRFPDAKVVVLSCSEFSSLATEARVECIRLERRHLSIWGVPKLPIRKQVERLHSDIAVDLSLCFDPLAAFICSLSKAPLRVGFALPHNDLVCNYQVAPQPSQTPAEQYRVLARYIG